MRSRMLTFSVILLSGLVAAQTPAQGNINNPPQQSGGYIVSPPTIALGNGITPTTVTNQDTVTLTSPQNTSYNGSSVQAANPTNANDVNSQSANGNTVNSNQNATMNQQGAASANRNFDFIKAPGGESGPIAGSMSDDSVSLGDVARQVRNGKQISKRTITNADVNAMNQQFPGSSDNANGVSGNAIASPTSGNGAPIGGMNATQNSGGTAGAVEPQSSTPAYAQPSTHDPFAAPARVNDGTKPNPQQGSGIEPRRSSPPASTSPSGDSSQAPQSDSSKQQLPRSSSSLPLLGTLGALSTLAGICYIKMR